MAHRRGEGDAHPAASFFFLVPPLAGLMALGVLGEAMPPVGRVGMAVAAAGVVIATRGQRNVATAVAGRSGDEHV